MIRKFFRALFLTVTVLGLLVSAVGMLVGLYFYFRLTRDLPKIEKLSDYMPPAVSSFYTEDNTIIGEVFGERRYPVKLGDIPPLVKDAFLAAEDANFYSHPGVDIVSIVRAVWINLARKATRQGASTITQQVVKSLLLSRERTYERKAKEALLSYRLEKALTKDEIFEIYLNEIFLGNHTYGIKAAARGHFHKELDQLSIAQIAFLAGLPQRPSELVNPVNHGEAVRRRAYVLEQMVRNKKITPAERDTALKEELKIYPPDLQTVFHAPYFESHAMRVADEILHNIDRRYSLKSPGGFKITTTVDLHATDIAERALRRSLREVDKRRGWRGPLTDSDIRKRSTTKTDAGDRPRRPLPEELRVGEVVMAKIVSVNPGKNTAEVTARGFAGTVNIGKAEWAKRFLNDKDEPSSIDPIRLLKAEGTIDVALDEEKYTDRATVVRDKKAPVFFQLDQMPEIEGAFTVLNPHTGAVRAIIGGYDFENNEFNRATQGLLQPGSSFKPFIYLAALEALHYTPSTMVPDSPISLVAGNGKVWTPGNFDGKFLGPMTLRTALAKSRNVVSVFMLNKMGIDRGIESARKLGITTPISRNMSISLGSAEVRLLEMVRAYGVFAANGWLANSLIVTKIEDRNGQVIYEQRPRQKQVVSEEIAFLMANMMKGVVERGTATVLKQLGIPVAGKTGTTNDHMDAWFIGYTPEWAAGVWVGFDQKRSIGKMETGGKTAAPVFLYFMQEFLKDVPPIDFDIPPGVSPTTIDLASGRRVDPSTPGAFVEYFLTGTEPSPVSSDETMDQIPQDYLSSDEF